jgi:hypothetical protein
LVSTLLISALCAALLAALGFAVRGSRHPTGGRHTVGSAARARLLAPLTPLAFTTLLVSPWRGFGDAALAAAILWSACLPLAALTRRFRPGAHSAWSLLVVACAAVLVWSGWQTSTSAREGVAVGLAWALWLVGVAAVAVLAVASWEAFGGQRLQRRPLPAAPSLRLPGPAPVSWLGAGMALTALAVLVQQGSSAPGSATARVTGARPPAPAPAVPSPAASPVQTSSATVPQPAAKPRPTSPTSTSTAAPPAPASTTATGRSQIAGSTAPSPEATAQSQDRTSRPQPSTPTASDSPTSEGLLPSIGVLGGG